MLHIITGPPCAGKSTYMREHAQDGDVLVDYDLIAQAFGRKEPHASRTRLTDPHLAAFVARSAVIDWALEHASDVESWIIHTSPTPEDIETYAGAGAEIITLDTDMETCLRRAEDDGRPSGTDEAIREWFENNEAPEGAFLMPEKEASMEKQYKAAEAATIDGGSVKGYASTFVCEPDSYGDVIAKGAFAESLERWKALEAEGKSIPLLYGHNTDDPFHNIGRVVSAEEDDYGLFIEAEFDADNETAQYVRKLVQEGRVYQFSFAYSVLDAEEIELEDGRKANELRKLDIYEISLVQIPANQTAVVTEIKAMEDIAAEIKSGRRNSAKDAKELARIGELASEISEAVSGLLAQAEDEPEATGGKSEGGESREVEAEFAEAYKQALKIYYESR